VEDVDLVALAAAGKPDAALSTEPVFSSIVQGFCLAEAVSGQPRADLDGLLAWKL